MRKTIHTLAVAALIGTGALAGCGSQEVEVELGAPVTAEEQARLAPMLQAEQAMRDAHKGRLQEGEGQ